jgi:hypothetical protein
MRWPLALLTVVPLAAAARAVPAQAQESTATVDDPNADDVATLPTATSRPRRYDRKQWKHWTDDDRDCQDTRNEVLIAESEVPVAFRDRRRCKVAAGRWTCPYTGKTFTDPRRLDIDHLVPLGNAARSGGQAWDRVTKRRYANDLDDPRHLIAVDASANRAKGDRGPEKWMPPRSSHRCPYLRAWVAMKRRWNLGVSPSERAALTSGLATCSARLSGKTANRKEAAERGAGRASGALMCNDGTESPTCTCGGPRRGCCSHHGGVAGCR